MGYRQICCQHTPTSDPHSEGSAKFTELRQNYSHYTNFTSFTTAGEAHRDEKTDAMLPFQHLLGTEPADLW